MYPEFRRLPAEQHERPRHMKRLDIVLPTNDPCTDSPLLLFENSTPPATTSTPILISSASSTKIETTTTTTPTPISQAKPTSSAVSTASALPSTLPVLSSLASSQTSASTTPSATTSSRSSHPATVPSSSPLHTSQSVVLTTASPSPTTNNNNALASASSRLSGGAVGGIIAASLIASFALLILIVRKTYLRRRRSRRVSWPNGNIFNEVKPPPEAPTEDFSEKPASVMSAPISPFDMHGRHSYVTQPPQSPFRATQSPIAGYATPTPPDPSYNNPMPPYSGYPTLNPRNSDTAVSMVRAAAGADSYPTPAPSAPRLNVGAEAFVSRAFIPSLPDELSVTGGERIRVLTLYDDGWALCSNGRGEKGMVPQECLDQRVTSDEEDWRNSKRSSSLNFDARRY